jgi:hypothetical protein
MNEDEEKSVHSKLQNEKKGRQFREEEEEEEEEEIKAITFLLLTILRDNMFNDR